MWPSWKTSCRERLKSNSSPLDAGGAVESEVNEARSLLARRPVERPDVQEILPGKAQVAQNVSLTQLVHLDEPADLGAPLLDPDIVLPRFVPGLELPDGFLRQDGLDLLVDPLSSFVLLWWLRGHVLYSPAKIATMALSRACCLSYGMSSKTP